MRRGSLLCLLFIGLYVWPVSAAPPLSETDWSTLKSIARVGPLGGHIGNPLPATCTVGQLYFDTGAVVGEQLSLCVATDNWQPVQASSAVPTLEQVATAGRSITFATGFPNAVLIGSLNTYWAIYLDPTDGLRIACVVNGVPGDCNHVIKLNSGFYIEYKNSSGSPIFHLDESTGALTYTTYDAEGTNNTLKLKRYLTKEFAACQAGIASTIWDYPSSNAPTAACKGSNMAKGVLEFPDGATDLTTTIKEYLHEDWTGAIEATLVWESASTSTNNALWSIAIACAGASESSDPAFSDDDFPVDANNASANTYNLTAVNTVTTTGTCTANKIMHLRLKRKLSDAADTLAATAQAVLLVLKIRESQ